MSFQCRGNFLFDPGLTFVFGWILKYVPHACWNFFSPSLPRQDIRHWHETITKNQSVRVLFYSALSMYLLLTSKQIISTSYKVCWEQYSIRHEEKFFLFSSIVYFILWEEWWGVYLLIRRKNEFHDQNNRSKLATKQKIYQKQQKHITRIGLKRGR